MKKRGEHVSPEELYQTRIIDMRGDFEEGIRQGATLIRNGELVAFPTETVYGLGTDALRSEAVSTIFAAKGRPADNPLIVHVAAKEDAFRYAFVTADAEKLMEAFWPGPLTIILKKRDVIPYEVSGGLKTVGLRMPDDAVALALIRASDRPIAAPSANRSGRPSPTTAQHVYEDLKGRIPLILDGGPSNYGVESTVLSMGDVPTILRPGIISPEMIAQVIGYVEVGEAVLQPMDGDEPVASPGMKYRHYAPRANVTLVEGESDLLPRAINRLYDTQTRRGMKSIILGSEENSDFFEDRDYVIMGRRAEPLDICRSFFSLLREADRNGADEIIIEAIPSESTGLAFMNRALRAAAFHVVYAEDFVPFDGSDWKASTGGRID